MCKEAIVQVSTGNPYYCMPCWRAYKKEWRLKNKEKEQARQQAWRLNNQDHLRQYEHRRYWSQRDSMLAKARREREKNPEKLNARFRDYYHRTREKMIEKAKAYAKEHRDQINARNRASRPRRIGKIRAWKQAYYRRHAEALGVKSKAWKQSSSGRVSKSHSEAKRRSRLLHTSDITRSWLLALKQQTFRCPLCNIELFDDGRRPNGKSLDHIIPLCAGGLHLMCNVRYICKRCNSLRPKDASDIWVGMEREQQALIKTIEAVEL